MRYTPINGAEDAVSRVSGLGYDHFVICTYETSWQREQGEPTIQVEHDASRAVDVFLDGCWMNPCVELRGVGFDGNEEALCIGGTDEDLNEEGEFIEWPELE